MTSPATLQHPASVDAYIRHGWSLVPIPKGTKGPQHKGWNQREHALKSQADLPPQFGIGLAHAYSGTMALDVDDWDRASFELMLKGVDLQALYDAPDAVTINSGRPGHGKLLYAMPFGLTLPSKKIQQSGVTAYELRCATVTGLTVQDVIPPSIHPDTGSPYRWGGLGHWTRLPVIPQALLDLWQSLVQRDQQIIPNTGEYIGTSWTEIQQVLDFIDPNCSREDWVNVGMALHWAGHQTGQLDQALQVWDEWSRPSEKYKGERDILTQWRSFKPDRVNPVRLGTLFYLAEQGGYTRPAPDVSALFAAVGDMTEPGSIMDGLRPAPPPLDLDLFPAVLRDHAEFVSGTVGCDPIGPLWAGLAAVCAVMDSRSRLELQSGFKVPPVLWLCTLGDSGSKKTPGSTPMLAPLDQIQIEDRERYQTALLAWEGQEAAYAAAKKAFLAYASSPEGVLDPAAAPYVPDLPPQPVPLRLTVSDITSQSLVRKAADRPRGLLCVMDEMKSWCQNITDPKSGENRSAWVRSYEGNRYEMDRVGAGSILCENFAISLCGNIQPRVFDEYAERMADDGLLQRFTPAILRHTKVGLSEPNPDTRTADQWEHTLRLIFSLPPMLYTLSPDARMEFRDFQRRFERARQDYYTIGASDTFMGLFSKLEGNVGRLALLLHVLREPFSSVVSLETISAAIDIMRTYVLPSARYVLGELGGLGKFDKWLVEYIAQHADRGLIQMADLRRSARRQLEKLNKWEADQALFGAMSLLEENRWVLRIDKGERERWGQAEWAINPMILTKTSFVTFRKEVIAARQREKDFIHRFARDKKKPRLVHGAEILQQEEPG